MFMAASSFANHLTNFRSRNFIFSIILIVFDFLLLVFSIVLFFIPSAELKAISVFIALSLMMAGFSEIGNSLSPNNEIK